MKSIGVLPTGVGEAQQITQKPIFEGAVVFLSIVLPHLDEVTLEWRKKENPTYQTLQVNLRLRKLARSGIWEFYSVWRMSGQNLQDTAIGISIFQLHYTADKTSR